MSWSLYTEDPVCNMGSATMTTASSVTRKKKPRLLPVLPPSADSRPTNSNLLCGITHEPVLHVSSANSLD